MEYITLPGTELKVSRICLGTMQFSNSWEWPCDQATATAVVDAAIKEGINFFDTAQVRTVVAVRLCFRIILASKATCSYGCIVGERACAICPARRLIRSMATAAPRKCSGLHLGHDGAMW